LARQGRLNGRLDDRHIRRLCGQADRGVDAMLSQASKRLGLSARGLTRLLRVARTVADLDAETEVSASHVAEALQFRMAEPGPL
jgi:magnesium chelatase family protein